MCGICGEVRFDGAPVDVQVLARMRDRLEHRGPDHADHYVAANGSAGLAFRRLRIIDLSAAANQPLANEDGSVRIVFNGEIYNYQALRAGLEARGHHFRSQSDTETIVHLYEERGADCVEELDGMFALAIFDERHRRLVLARDRAGKKPLYYHHDGRRLLFASEIKALFAHPQVEAQVEPDAVPAYFLHGYVPGPRTWYRGVRQVEPAGVMSFDETGAATTRRYWALEYPDAAAPVAPEFRDRAAVVSRVRDLVTAAVKRRLLSDVPLGAFLSGGIDSTVVVGVMHRLGVAPLKTFSIGFEGDPAYDETAVARRTAARFETDHTEFRVTASAVDLIDTLIWHHDGAFGDSSAIPTYLVAQLTRPHVTVALTGDGGDEVFAGYLRFRAALAADRVPAVIGRGVGGLLQWLPAGPNERHWRSRLARLGRALGLPLHDRIGLWTSYFNADLEALVAGANGPIDRQAHLQAIGPALAGRSPLSQLLLANFASYLPDDLLVKTDRCTMANSLEARSPFLDRDLMEYVARLPDAFKLDGSRSKAVLREAFADLIPAEVDRRPKAGFGVPLDAWFRGELREYVSDLLLSPSARFREYLSAPVVAETLARHQRGAANEGQRLWALVCFERWLQLLPSWSAERR